MRKLMSLLLAIMMLLLSGAYAEESFVIAGYDHKDTKHVWTENEFFIRMEERTGVRLVLLQYDTVEAWDAAKAAMLSGTQELPDAFFKVVLTGISSGTPRAIGFIYKNEAGNYKRDSYVNTIDDVERITHLDFFPMLPDKVEEVIESRYDMSEWR